MVRVLFPVPVGPEMDIPTGFPRFHHCYRSRDYLPIVTTRTIWWGTRYRRDFHFRSRYFRFRPGCNPWFFSVNFRANGDLRTTSTRMRSQPHARGLGQQYCFGASGRSSSGSGRSGTGSEPDIELEEAGKPVGFILDVRF